MTLPQHSFLIKTHTRTCTRTHTHTHTHTHIILWDIETPEKHVYYEGVGAAYSSEIPQKASSFFNTTEVLHFFLLFSQIIPDTSDLFHSPDYAQVFHT